MATSIIQRYPIIGQFVRFALIGGINTGVDLLILNILTISSGQTEGTPFVSLRESHSQLQQHSATT